MLCSKSLSKFSWNSIIIWNIHFFLSFLRSIFFLVFKYCFEWTLYKRWCVYQWKQIFSQQGKTLLPWVDFFTLKQSIHLTPRSPKCGRGSHVMPVSLKSDKFYKAHTLLRELIIIKNKNVLKYRPDEHWNTYLENKIRLKNQLLFRK